MGIDKTLADIKGGSYRFRELRSPFFDFSPGSRRELVGRSQSCLYIVVSRQHPERIFLAPVNRHFPAEFGEQEKWLL
jgi:hypothetical protein